MNIIMHFTEEDYHEAFVTKLRDNYGTQLKAYGLQLSTKNQKAKIHLYFSLLVF
tara:strand:+ start:481 stop:642 length:162 start_codon:yes stop_codon:yes gene_type:complete